MNMVSSTKLKITSNSEIPFDYLLLPGLSSPSHSSCTKHTRVAQRVLVDQTGGSRVEIDVQQAGAVVGRLILYLANLARHSVSKLLAAALGKASCSSLVAGCATQQICCNL